MISLFFMFVNNKFSKNTVILLFSVIPSFSPKTEAIIAISPVLQNVPVAFSKSPCYSIYYIRSRKERMLRIWENSQNP